MPTYNRRISRKTCQILPKGVWLSLLMVWTYSPQVTGFRHTFHPSKPNFEAQVGDKARRVSLAILYASRIASPSANHNTASLSSLIESAADLLQDQPEGLPLDAALRRYSKQPTRSTPSPVDKEHLRTLVLGVARRQMRIEGRLYESGLRECTLEQRVVTCLALDAGHETVDDTGHDLQDIQHYYHVDRKSLMAHYPWLERVIQKGGTRLETDTLDWPTRLECPPWAWSRMCEAFGEDVTRQLRALQRPAPLDVRVNTLQGTSRHEALEAIRKMDPAAQPTPYSSLGIRLSQRVPLGQIPGLLQGKVEPQDEGSQLVAALLDAQPGDLVADYCAGTGGKTLQIAAQMQNKGRLVAMDIHADRLERGRPRCHKAGVSNVQRQVLEPDMTRKDKWCKRRRQTFDRVLVDAPCSGVGSWRRKPDARHTWGATTKSFEDDDDEADLETHDRGTQRLRNLLPLQQQILTRASRLVKPGGRLVYITCSLLPEENEEQVQTFLNGEEGQDWALSPPNNFVVPFNLACNQHDHQCLRLTPADHQTDGFFAAVLTRKIIQ